MQQLVVLTMVCADRLNVFGMGVRRLTGLYGTALQRASDRFGTSLGHSKIPAAMSCSHNGSSVQ